MKVLPGFICAIFFCVLPAGAEDGLEKAAREVSARIAGKPERVPDIFDQSIFRQISLESLTGVLAGIYRENGAVSETLLVSSSAGSANFFFDTERGYRVPAELSLDPATGKINGLFFGPAYKKAPVLKNIRERLAALPGRTGLLVRRLGEKPENLEARNEDAYFAVGSASALYVLGALVKEGVSWEKVLRLKTADKYPSAGRLRGWPDGAPLTAHTLAAMMISEGDNTASDALVSALGRRTIEADLASLGHSDPGRLKPFLKASERFRLGTYTEAALKYLNLPVGEKYGFLSSLGTVPPAPDKVNLSHFGADRLEWAASPSDLCRLMAYFAGKKEVKSLEILALNTGLDIPRGKIIYAGYMGGSGPGLLSMTWLIKNTRSEWFCLSASWNNGNDQLDEKEFLGLMQSAIGGLED